MDTSGELALKTYGDDGSKSSTNICFTYSGLSSIHLTTHMLCRTTCCLKTPQQSAAFHSRSYALSARVPGQLSIQQYPGYQLVRAFCCAHLSCQCWNPGSSDRDTPRPVLADTKLNAVSENSYRFCWLCLLTDFCNPCPIIRLNVDCSDPKIVRSLGCFEFSGQFCWELSAPSSWHLHTQWLLVVNCSNAMF